MRISDWSSDVCSSVLQTTVHVQRCPRHVTGFARRQVGHRRGDIVRRTEPLYRYTLHQCLSHIFTERLRHVGVDETRCHDIDGDATRADLLRQRLRKADQPRSEEHTSELQSLMRISYAVFCLKKKT